MKYIISLISFIVSSPIYAAPMVVWDASAGAEGYNVYCGETPVGTPPAIDVGNVLAYDLAATVSAGIQYECWVTAYAAGFAESADSNHLQFTPPQTVQTIVVPGQPSSVTVSWQ